MEDILKIWELDEVDVNIKDLKFLSSPDKPTTTLATANEGTKSQCLVDHKHCASCHACNVLDANWCIECGCAMIEKNSSAVIDRSEKACGILQTNFEVDEMYNVDHKHSRPHSNGDVIPSTLTDDYKVTEKASEQQDHHFHIGQRTRHWETSKFYAWRKPRSKPIHNLLNSNKYSVMPSLDMLDIDSTEHYKVISMNCNNCALIFTTLFTVYKWR